MPKRKPFIAQLPPKDDRTLTEYWSNGRISVTLTDNWIPKRKQYITTVRERGHVVYRGTQEKAHAYVFLHYDIQRNFLASDPRSDNNGINKLVIPKRVR